MTGIGIRLFLTLFLALMMVVCVLCIQSVIGQVFVAQTDAELIKHLRYREHSHHIAVNYSVVTAVHVGTCKPYPIPIEAFTSVNKCFI